MDLDKTHQDLQSSFSGTNGNPWAQSSSNAAVMMNLIDGLNEKHPSTKNKDGSGTSQPQEEKVIAGGHENDSKQGSKRSSGRSSRRKKSRSNSPGGSNNEQADQDKEGRQGKKKKKKKKRRKEEEQEQNPDEIGPFLNSGDTKPLPASFIELLIHSFKDGKILCKDDAMELITRVSDIHRCSVRSFLIFFLSFYYTAVSETVSL